MEPVPWPQFWSATVARVAREFAALDAAGRERLETLLARIVVLKQALHALFLAAAGPARCAACQGSCCDKGRHHVTLVEVLEVIRHGEPFPAPRPAAPCPMLGAEGCLLPPARRPFNCLTFHCEAIEECLSPAEVARFYALEKELRALYQELERLHAGVSLRGLLIRAGQLGGRPLLGPP